MGQQYTDYLERTVNKLGMEAHLLKQVLVCPINQENSPEYCSAGCCYQCLLEKAKEIK